jgi:hypothetical protein
VYSVFSIAWQYDTYMMSFANDVFPRPNFADPKAPDIEGWGAYFYGSNGTLQVNRMGGRCGRQCRRRAIASHRRPHPGTAGAVAGGGARAGGAPGGGGAGGGAASPSR